MPKLTWTKDGVAPVGKVGALLALDMAGMKMSRSKLPKPGKRVRFGACAENSYELGNHKGQLFIRRR